MRVCACVCACAWAWCLPEGLQGVVGVVPHHLVALRVVHLTDRARWERAMEEEVG